MMEPEQIRTYAFYVLITFIIIVSILIFINLNDVTFDSPQNKKLTQVVTMEAMETKGLSSSEDDTSGGSSSNIKMNPAGDFCTTHKGSSNTLVKSCGKLTNKNCNLTSCCVLLNGSKCVPGNEDGPTYKTLKGQPIEIDYYYYQNKKY